MIKEKNKDIYKIREKNDKRKNGKTIKKTAKTLFLILCESQAQSSRTRAK